MAKKNNKNKKNPLFLYFILLNNYFNYKLIILLIYIMI